MSVILLDLMADPREDLMRRRKTLELQASKPQSFESLCSLAHYFGELCHDEDVLNNPQYARSGRWRMD